MGGILCGERITAIDSLLSPLRGTPAAYLNAPLACFLAYVKYASTRRFACAPFLAPKALRQIWNPWFFGTNSGSVYEPLMGRFVLCWERSGDRSIGGANLCKGRQPLLWKRHCRPLQWPAHLAPGWHTSRLASALSSVLHLRGNSKYVQNCMILRFVENIFELRAKFKSLFRRV